MGINSLSKDLETLQSHKSDYCVSVIVPTYRGDVDRGENRIVIEKAVKKAKEQVVELLRSRSEMLNKKVDENLASLDLKSLKYGIGIFVSPEISKTINFPFPVKEKIIIGDSFEVRDLVFSINRMSKYWVLSLSLNKSDLYYGFGDTLTLIKDSSFPIPFEDQYQHQPVSKPYDANKSADEQTRVRQYFRKIDKMLGSYLQQNPVPVLLAGVEQHIGYYKKVSKHQDVIFGEIKGHFDERTKKELSRHAFEVIQAYQKNQRGKVLKQMKEAVGKHLCVWGIKDVLKAVKEGRGKTLIVEKNYMSPYLTEGEGKRGVKVVKKLSDVVDDVVETVLQKGGQVYFIDNGDLKNFDRIALILRYPLVSSVSVV